jgi:hypothetical protein
VKGPSSIGPSACCLRHGLSLADLSVVFGFGAATGFPSAGMLRRCRVIS